MVLASFVNIYTINLWHFMDEKSITDIILDFSTATNVEIELPVPPDSTNPNVRTSMGSASYAPESDSLIWKIKSFPGGKVGTFLGKLGFSLFFLVPGDGLWSWTCPSFIFDVYWFVCFQEYMLRAEFRLPSIVSEEAAPERKAPIRVKFEIPYFTVSGIQVRAQMSLHSKISV